MPLALNNGNAELNLATGITEDNQVIRKTRKIDLATKNREENFELALSEYLVQLEIWDDLLLLLALSLQWTLHTRNLDEIELVLMLIPHYLKN